MSCDYNECIKCLNILKIIKSSNFAQIGLYRSSTDSNVITLLTLIENINDLRIMNVTNFGSDFMHNNIAYMPLKNITFYMSNVC